MTTLLPLPKLLPILLPIPILNKTLSTKLASTKIKSTDSGKILLIFNYFLKF